MATRMQVLEDALLSESGACHPLLAQNQHVKPTDDIQPSSPIMAKSWIDHRMESGVLMYKGGKSEPLYGTGAAETGPLYRHSTLAILGLVDQLDTRKGLGGS